MPSLWGNICDEASDIRDGKPGNRFQRYRRHQDDMAEDRRGKSYWIARSVVAAVLIVVGVAIGWLPGPGGFLAIVGIALLVPTVPGLAPLLDRFEHAFRRTCSRVMGNAPESETDQ